MIELYINGKLCDVGKNFSVRLRRQFIKPGDLNLKDSQMSYSIDLPPTANNHAAFGYVNVEEVQDKFNRDYNAELIVNSVRLLKGKFRMSEISESKYKGNLYVPKAKEVSDIFGEMNLSEAAPYPIPFTEFAQSVNTYNTSAAPQPAIFPYTLYGLLPKVPADNGDYTAREVWDNTVRLGVQDFPPSINVLQLIRHLFASNGYNIRGTAFNDEKLKRLYMSYKNDPSYVQPWNWARLGRMRLSGTWSNVYNIRPAGHKEHLERKVYENGGVYTCDMLNSDNAKIVIEEDPGDNITYSEKTDDGATSVATQVRIPASGYYKITLNADIQLGWGFGHIYSPGSPAYVLAKDGGIENFRSAVKVLRTRSNADFGLSDPRVDGVYYHDNLPQVIEVSPDNPVKWFPSKLASGADMLFVDPKQNAKFVQGLQWGKRSNAFKDYKEDVKPLDTGTEYAQVNAAKPGMSWDSSSNDFNYAIAWNPEGYKNFNTEDDGRGGYVLTEETEGEMFKYDLYPYTQTLNYAYRGDRAGNDKQTKAYGSVKQIVWLEAGELLTIADTSDTATDGNKHWGWGAKRVNFDLTIEPYKKEKDWLKVDRRGNITGSMRWNEEPSFDTDTLNLTGFLPRDMKTKDFIDNFCKAFNLRVTPVDDKNYELNIKQQRKDFTNQRINLDSFTSVRDRANQPLGLPYMYRLGFTVDKDEEGFFLTGDDGGGEFLSGARGDEVIEQKSSFSYNWFKEVTKDGVTLPLAVISKHDVWNENTNYAEVMGKRGTDQALRFWYHDGTLNDLGATFEFNGEPLTPAKVSNVIPGVSELNYKNRNRTILDYYFNTIVSGSSCYTTVEGYLPAGLYNSLNGSIMATFNGDLYYIAEISGYDPTGRNKTTLKLIKK